MAKRCLRAADVLAVTTEPLAQSYSEFNPNIAVLPNQLDSATLERQPIVSDRVKVGWQGASTHSLDLGAFNTCNSDIKHLEYAVFGIPTVAIDIAAYNSIENGVTGYLVRNGADWEQYIAGKGY